MTGSATPAPAPDAAAPAATQWDAIGVAVRVVVTDPQALPAAERILRDEVTALDLACSRFRDDSELTRVNVAARDASTAELEVPVGPLLAEAIEVALDAAARTDGDVDPTLGTSLVELGYDRTFAQLPDDAPAVRVSVQRPATWSQLRLDRQAGRLSLPRGVQLDLGATAKALGSDRAARRIHQELGCGVLVSLGGDIAVAGDPPPDGWTIRVQDRPGRPEALPDGPTSTVAIRAGGLATSSTTARRWQRGGSWLHHVLDPRTGMPAPAPWRTVSVAAGSCVDANVATTAAIVRGEAAVDWLHRIGVPARLVAQDGTVTVLNGWPA